MRCLKILAGMQASPRRLARWTAAFALLPAVAFAGVDLVVNNTDTPDPVPAGGTVTYLVRVTNNSPGTGATGVKSTHTVSAGAKYLGHSGTGVNCSGMALNTDGPGTLTCTLPDLPQNGGEATLSIQLKSATAGSITLGATVTANEPDDDTANNTLDESTTVVAGANVAIAVTPSATSAPSGSMVGLTLQLSNSGPDAATNLVVSTPVPTGLSIVSLPAGCGNSGSVITCGVAGPISPGGTLALGTISGQIVAASNSDITSTSSVQVSPAAPAGTAQDPDVNNNTAVTTIHVTPGSDVKIAKARSVGGNLLVGQTLNFVLTPTYSGDGPGALTITDTIPANYTIGTVPTPQNGWSCTVSGQTVTCAKAGGGPAGANQALGTITIPVTAASAGSAVTNSAGIASATLDPDTANNTANDGGVNILAPTVNLGVAKTGPNPALVVTGVPFDYRVTANNTGTVGYHGTMTVTDNLPAGLTVNGYTLNGWSCAPAAPVTGPASIACSRTYTSVSPLAPNATTPAIILNATASITGNINNSVTITADCNLGAGNCGDGDVASYAVTASANGASADIRLLKSVVGPDPVFAGDVLTYRLEVVNNGPAASTNVVLTDTLDNLINNNAGATGAGFVGATVASGTATGASCTSVTSGSLGRKLSCGFASIPACTAGSDCPVVTVQVRPGGNGGSRVNTALAVSNGTADPDHTNDQASAASQVAPRADVTVSKSANPSSVPAGQPLTYLITATNIANGMSAADNVTITDTLPLNVTFVSATPSAGSCSTTPAANTTTGAGNRTVTCNLGTINNGSQRTVQIVVRPNTATRGTTLGNVVDVTTTTTEIDTSNNQATANAVVTAPVVDLVLNKVDTVDPVAVGDTTTYNITVTNSGPSAAENVVMNDPLPATGQMLFQSVLAPAGSSCTTPAVDAVGGTVSCNLGYLPAGASRTISIVTKGAAKGVYNNSASVMSDETAAGFDSNSANNTDSETTTVRTKADVELVSKTPSLAAVNLRDDFNFVIRVRNNGPANEADNVEVADTLPTNMELTGTPGVAAVSGTSTLAGCSGAAGGKSFTCSLGSVSNGAVLDITVPVRVVAVASLPQTFTNTASVTTSSLDTNPANNSKSGSVTVNSSGIAGRVFADMNNDGLVSAGETGIAGVTMTLTGTSFDGASITRTVVTDANGNYAFTGIPQGTYQIAEGAVDASLYADGIDTAGTAGGNATAVNDRISGIVLPSNTSAAGYNFAEVPIPRIGVAKSAGAVVNNGDGTYDVDFTLTVTNAGNGPLGSVQVSDLLTGEFGSYTAGAPLAGQYTIVGAPVVVSQTNGAAVVPAAAGAFTGSGSGTGLLAAASSSLPNHGAGAASTAQLRFKLRFFPTTAGPFHNAAVATGVSPANVTVTDDSVDGLVPDANGNGNPNDDKSPTVVNLAGQSIGLAKAAGAIVQTGARRYRIPYTLIVKNLSATVTATNVQVSDNLAAAFPTAQSITISAPATVTACTGTVLRAASPAFNGVGQTRLLAGNQNLQAGEQCTIGFSAEVDFGSRPLPAAVQNNQAEAGTAQTPGGTVIASDLSDDGVLPDANGNGNGNEPGENDPTPVNLSPAGHAAVTGKVYLDRNHDRDDNDGSPAPSVAGFRVQVFNGEGTLVGETVTADDGSYRIEGLYPSTPGNAATYYRLHFIEPASGAIYGLSQSSDPNPARNGVIVNGEITQLQLAAGVTTLNQNLPLDPSGVVYNAVTREPVAGAAVTLLHNGAPVSPSCLVGGINTQVTGATGMYQFLLNNPPPAACPGASGTAQTYTLQVAQPAGYLPPASSIIPPGASPYVPGAGGVAAIQPQAVAPTGNQATTYYLAFSLLLSGLPASSSSSVVNNHVPLDPILGGAIAMTKSTPLVNVKRGDLVPYTITATNTLAATLNNINVVDTIPPGFRYRSGTATLDGVPLEPKVSGRSLTWPNQSFAANQRKTLRMLLVVGTGVSEGEYVNRVVAINNVVDSSVSNTASAAVRVVPDETFDCSDLIGKVFDDKNANGYQDEGEPGIANVRLATPRGLLVTTDHEGRFHIACADVPNADRGSNFVLKLDERTLPSGYRLTTENPRDARLTRGKMSKLNFGATVHRVVRVEISGAAFEEGGAILLPQHAAMLDALPDRLAQRPSVLRIAYRRGAESAELAAKRMDAIRQRIKERWESRRKKNENQERPAVYPLLIETEMEVAQ